MASDFKSLEEELNALIQRARFAEVERITAQEIDGFSGPDEERVYLMVARARAVARMDRLEEALTLMHDAVRLAHRTGNVKLLVIALDSRAEMRCHAEDFTGALFTLQSADNYLRDAGIKDRYISALLNQTRGIAYSGCGLWDEANRYLLRCLDDLKYLRLWPEWTYAAGDFAVMVLGRAESEGIDRESLENATSLLDEALPLLRQNLFAQAFMQLHRLRFRTIIAEMTSDGSSLQALSREYAHLREDFKDLIKSPGGYPIMMEWTKGAVLAAAGWFTITQSRRAEELCRFLDDWVSTGIRRLPRVASLKLYKVRLQRALASSSPSESGRHLSDSAETLHQCIDILQGVISGYREPLLKSGVVGGLRGVVEEVARLAAVASHNREWPLVDQLLSEMQLLRTHSREELMRSATSEDTVIVKERTGVQARLMELERWLRQVKDDYQLVENSSESNADGSLPVSNPDAPPGSRQAAEDVMLQFAEYDRISTLAHLETEVEKQRACFVELSLPRGKGEAAPSARVSRSPSIETIRRCLGPHDLVLDYYMGTRSLHVGLLSKHDASVRFVTETTPSVLYRKIETYLKKNAARNDESLPAVDELSELLFPAALRTEISGRRPSRIFIVPSGPLWRVPFGWLRIENSYLLEHAAVCVVPAMRFVGIAKHSMLSLDNAIVIGCEGKPPLRHLEDEMKTTAGLLNCDAYWNGETTHPLPTPSLLKNDILPNKNLIHISCHGEQVATSPLLSNLQLFPDETHADGKLMLSELLETKLRGGLINLAACDTGALHGPATFPETLAHSMLGAGACFVVASLWRAQDKETLDFNTAFYESLAKDTDVIDAFTAAQRRCLEVGRQARNGLRSGVVNAFGNFVLMGALDCDG